MEALIIIVIVAVLWKVGVLATVKSVADVANDSIAKSAKMANSEMDLQVLSHRESVLKRIEKMEDISGERYKAAAAKVAALKSFEL